MSAVQPASPRTSRRTVLMAALLLLGGCTLIACTTVRDDLGRSQSACYLALPSAAKAAADHHRLVGVQLLTVNSLKQHSGSLFDELHLGQPSGQRVCAFAFEGTFTQGSVSKPLGQPSGHLLVVVLTSPSNRLIGSVIGSHLPLDFGHPHIG
jgi:hypothetical protein